MARRIVERCLRRAVGLISFGMRLNAKIASSRERSYLMGPRRHVASRDNAAREEDSVWLSQADVVWSGLDQLVAV